MRWTDKNISCFNLIKRWIFFLRPVCFGDEMEPSEWWICVEVVRLLAEQSSRKLQLNWTEFTVWETNLRKKEKGTDSEKFQSWGGEDLRSGQLMRDWVQVQWNRRQMWIVLFLQHQIYWNMFLICCSSLFDSF